MRKSDRLIRAAVVAALASLPAATTLAVDNLWTGAVNNDWNNPGNWSLGRVPTNANGAPAGDTFDDAVVNTNAPNIATISANLAATPRDIVVATGAGKTAALNHTAGTAQTGGGNWMFIGRDGGNGTYNLTGTAGALGTFTQKLQGSGSMTVGDRMYVAGHLGAPATGVVNINTTGTLKTNGDLNMGAAAGTGTVNLDAGTVSVGGWLSIGRDENGTAGGPTAGGTGNWNQSGGTVTVSGNTILGLPGTKGNMTMTGGSLTTNGEWWVGNGVGQTIPSTGVANISGGTVTTNNWIALGRDGSVGTITLSGGGTISKTGGGAVVVGTNTNGTGTINVNGGNFTIAEPGPDNPADPNQQYNNDLVLGELNGAKGTVVQTAGTVTIGGDLRLAGKNVGETGGSGTYTLQGGTLDLTAGAILPGGGTAVFNFAGGRLKNAATVSLPLTQTAGVIAPGASVGTTAIGANYTLGAGGTYEAELTGGATTSDKITVAGTATLAGQLDTVPLGTMTVGSTYTILTATTLAGTFANAPAGSFTQDGITFNISYANNAVTLAVTAVPEPASLSLVGLGAGALLLRRRRPESVV
jgi:hypothetical protein